MRRIKQEASRIKRGQTIVAEREWAESESERMQTRKRVRRKRMTSVILVILMVTILGLLTYMGAKNVAEEVAQVSEKNATYVVKAEIVDETGHEQISSRTREYIGLLEQDFKDMGYIVTRVTLPAGMSRELYVDLNGEDVYFKVNMDRDTAVTVEDAVRMLKYLRDKDIHPSYVDVRLDGKAYYK